jgi:hypothetical protein
MLSDSRCRRFLALVCKCRGKDIKPNTHLSDFTLKFDEFLQKFT